MSRSNLRLATLCAALALVAALPRFARLDALSFYGDEDITVLVASAVNRGEGAQLPSGMEYRRALPFTWLTAATARLFGETGETSYRIPSALLGTLTVPLLFLLGRWLIGERVALLAALLLAFSEWHLVLSRHARMYAPFLFFYLAAAFALLVWARAGKLRYFALALVAVAAAATLHLIGLVVVVFALIPIAFPGRTRVAPLALTAFAAVAAAATQAYDRYFVAVTYAGWLLPPAPSGAAEAGGPPPFLETVSPWAVALAFVGGALGIWLVARTHEREAPFHPSSRPSPPVPASALRSAALFASAAAAGALAGAGQLYGFGLAAVVFLLIHPLRRTELARLALLPSALLLLVAVAGVYTALATSVPLRGVRALLQFPHPYFALLALELPGVCVLFGATVTWLALRRPQPEDHGLRISALAVFLPLAALGLSGRAPETRYALGVYPFLLLLAGAAVLALMELPRRWLTRWTPSVALAAAVILVSSGVIDGHGVAHALNAVRLQHGERLRARNALTRQPDHAAPGQFVRRMRAQPDVVIAEDPLQQRWYAGPVDYWFRRYGDARAYLYQGRDGRERDHYTGSALLADPLLIDSIIARAQGRVWFISSGETSSLRWWYLSPPQARWLDSLEQHQSPAFTGRDQATRVYCLNC